MFNWNHAELVSLLVGLAVMLVLAVLLGFLLKNKSRRARNLPFQLIAMFVLGMEIAKQCYYMFSSYSDLYILPLHFCSLFILVFPLAHFTSEKVSRIFKPMAFVYSVIVLCLGFAFPHVLLGSTTDAPFASFLNFHGFFYHFAVFFYPFLSIALGDYKPQLKDVLYVLLGLVVYVAYAVPGAYLLNVNYANILFSNMSLLENFRLWAGQIVYNILLFVVAAAGMSLVSIAYYFIYSWVKKLIEKKKA